MDEPAPLERRLTARFPSLFAALRGLDGRVTLIMTLSAVLLLLFRKFGGSSTFEAELRPARLVGHPFIGVYGDYYWFLSCFTLLGLIPALSAIPRALRPSMLGMGVGDWRFGLRWTGVLYVVMLPVVYAASSYPTFYRYYPLNELMGRQMVALLTAQATMPGFLLHFVAYELLYAVYFVGWEFFFRGYLTFGLYERLGMNGILIGNIPFVLLHLGKPFPEALGSIVAGLALGLFALRARSFWYCVLIHVGVAWTMDGCAILRKVEEALAAVSAAG